MEVSERAVVAMQVYLRLKRYILPSGIAREALQAAIPLLPSPHLKTGATAESLEDQLANERRSATELHTARQLALEEAARLVEGRDTGIDTDFIQALSGRNIHEIAGVIAAHDFKLAAAIRALSSPDHADAGKVEGDGCPQCGGKGEIVVGKGRHGDTIIEDCPSCSTPQDVINLVIAAREACDTWLLPECEFKRLDKALDAFSERVPFENEPDTLPSAPASEGAE
ncbi:hypothetical protein DK867_02525 [Ochrobactrum sp. POC9]|uniref:hypothetical protein n=1 Tax=Ochrobactrum sp. POC9 TaxID=2203419 RepID=UPI000D707BE3|nr:hypothetical protein [Ochrobactrum sp. POC9]PWU76165.1 hypothetical protein DK867_02525 [Ochrobactrum sp. POC9]